MYFKIKNRQGIKYLVMVESFRDPETGKVAKREVKSFGRFDQLPEEIRQAYEQRNVRKELAAVLAREATDKKLSKAANIAFKRAGTFGKDDAVIEGLVDDDELQFNGKYDLQFGHLALKPFWENELGLKYKINYLQKAYTDIDSWSLNDLLFYLTFIKIINPQSYLHASNHRSNFIYCPWSDANQDCYYRALDFVHNHKDELLSHAVKTHIERRGTGIRLAFFDCTNTWFETPYDDVTWRAIRYARDVRESMLKQGMTNDDVNAYMDTEEYKENLQCSLEQGKEDDLRMRGMSKEGRYAQPLISIALAVDDTGFPIDCRVFAGNISEIHQVEPVLNSLQEKYGLKDFYFVADRGINGTEVLSKVQEKNIGFVVAQKVSQQNEKTRKEMLDLTGYRNYKPDELGAFVSSECSELIEDASRFKVCDYIKTARIKGEIDPDTGKAKTTTVKVPCKIIYTFSPERKIRDLANLEQLKNKAIEAVSKRELIGASLSGWRSLVQTERTKATAKKKGRSHADKSEKENFRAIGLKEDVIANREAIAGYAAVIFDHPKSCDLEPLSATAVLDTYHKLVGIEENFRVMKSTFNIRPVYVRLSQRIEAHCYLCIFALMMLRLLQDTLLKQGYRMSAKRISQALSNAKVSAQKVTKDDIYFDCSRAGAGIFAPAYTGKGCLQEQSNDLVDKQEALRNFLKDQVNVKGETNIVLEAAGLESVDGLISLKQLKRKLKIGACPDSKILSYDQHELIKLALQ